MQLKNYHQENLMTNLEALSGSSMGPIFIANHIERGSQLGKAAEQQV